MLCDVNQAFDQGVGERYFSSFTFGSPVTEMVIADTNPALVLQNLRGLAVTSHMFAEPMNH